MQDPAENPSDTELSQQRRFDDVCDAYAEFILEAIETTFDESGGERLHPVERTEGDLIAILNRARTDA